MYLRYAIVLIVVLFLVRSAKADGELRDCAHEQLSAQSALAFDKAIGSSNPNAITDLAANCDVQDIVRALYGSVGSRRLIAIEVAGELRNPWPIMPFLAALLKSPARDVGARSARALLGNIVKIGKQPSFDYERIEGQIKQLSDILLETVQNESIEADIRVVAIDCIHLLQGFLATRDSSTHLFLTDSDERIRLAALSGFRPSFDKQELKFLADAVYEDSSWMVRGQAAALLCENALEHGVKKPSDDLSRLLDSVLVEEAPEEAFAPILGCLVRFPVEVRGLLVEKALSLNKDKIQIYWDELNK